MAESEDLDILVVWRAMLVEMGKRFGFYASPDGKLILLTGYPPSLATGNGRKVVKLTFSQAQTLFKVWENMATQLIAALNKAGRPTAHLSKDFRSFLDSKIEWTLYVTGGGCYPGYSNNCKTFPGGLVGSGGLLTAGGADAAVRIVQKFAIDLSSGKWTAFELQTFEERLRWAASGTILGPIVAAALGVAKGAKFAKDFIKWTMGLMGDTVDTVDDLMDIMAKSMKYAMYGSVAIGAYWLYSKVKK